MLINGRKCRFFSTLAGELDDIFVAVSLNRYHGSRDAGGMQLQHDPLERRAPRLIDADSRGDVRDVFRRELEERECGQGQDRHHDHRNQQLDQGKAALVAEAVYCLRAEISGIYGHSSPLANSPGSDRCSGSHVDDGGYPAQFFSHWSSSYSVLGPTGVSLAKVVVYFRLAAIPVAPPVTHSEYWPKASGDMPIRR